jgi:hypothetical protein
MTKTYRPYEQNQLLLLLPNMREWLPADHMVNFLSDVIDQLDISGIERIYEEKLRGYPPCYYRRICPALVCVN